MTNKEKSELQKEIVDYVGVCPHGRLLLAPRVGKTKLVIDIIKRDKPESILWVTSSSKLATEDIPEEFDKWKAKRFKAKLTTCTYSYLPKMIGDYSVIVLDEDQHLTEANAEAFFSGNLTCKNIISMTGTNTKHKDKLNLYSKLNLEVLYEISINQAVDIKLLADYQINVLNITPDKTKMKKYNQMQYLIDRNILGDAYITENQSHLVITGKMSAKLKIQEKESKYGGKLFTVFGSLGSIGYVVITDDGELKGKLTSNEGAKYQISQGKIHIPQPASLLIGRSKALGNSELKTEIAKNLLSELEGRKLMFSTSTKQASEISEHTYHSKTTNEALQEFKNGSIDEIVMVNKGGTGFTYKSLDHLIIVQCDSDRNGLTSQKICRTLLGQKDYKATVWILCVKDTRDEVWVESALESFDKNKVKYVNYEDKQ